MHDLSFLLIPAVGICVFIGLYFFSQRKPGESPFFSINKEVYEKYLDFDGSDFPSRKIMRVILKKGTRVSDWKNTKAGAESTILTPLKITFDTDDGVTFTCETEETLGLYIIKCGNGNDNLVFEWTTKRYAELFKNSV